MIPHDPACRCGACRQPGEVQIEARDCALLATEWAKARGHRDGEVLKLQRGEIGSPGSPRRIALQAIARARLAATAARAVGDLAETLLS